ncbi:leucine zipper kinase-like [Planoprotostelium fungivorum]|uniref:Leucine zipper kinase-like n=1 Tax=Planoprotostelium fungivorum TaxID=1890364 RepID=A0A2P6NVB2_9EUKA|nr:leucine zipper kinase-like [Planoprotostelium fungivorum]
MSTIQGPGFTYVDLHHINKGAYGEIISGRQSPSGKKVILKKISKSVEQHRVASEITAGHLLNGIKGVPQFHHHFETPNSYWLVSDLIDGCDLFQKLTQTDYKGVPERTVKHILTQLVRTLTEIHKRGISHKDIKLENIMVGTGSKPSTHFIDFGLCHQYTGHSDACSDFAGSREYAAPELLLAKKNFSSQATDVWALGVTMFSLLYGVFPFSFDADEQKTIEVTGIHPRPHFPSDGPKVSQDMTNLLSRMMESDPSKRITVKEMKSHPALKTSSMAFLRRSLTL